MDDLAAGNRGEEAYRLLGEKSYAEALAIYLELEAEGFCQVSSHLGYIYDHMQPRDVHKVKYYYGRAAEEGDAYGMYGLAGVLAEEGNFAEAVPLYDRATKCGETECYYPLYMALRKLGAMADANAALDAAAEHGNPFAIRNQSFRRLSGRDGLLNVFRGAAQYVRNLPALIRAANELYARRSKGG